MYLPTEPPGNLRTQQGSPAHDLAEVLSHLQGSEHTTSDLWTGCEVALGSRELDVAICLVLFPAASDPRPARVHREATGPSCLWSPGWRGRARVGHSGLDSTEWTCPSHPAAHREASGPRE